MRTTVVSLLFLAISYQIAIGQYSIRPIPSIELETLSGNKCNFQSLVKDKKNLMIIFSWGCCFGDPCLKILDSLEKYYQELEKDYDIKVLSLNYKICKTTWQECSKKSVEKNRWTHPFYWYDDYDAFSNCFFIRGGTCPSLVILNSVNNTFSNEEIGFSSFKKDVEEKLKPYKKQ